MWDYFCKNEILGNIQNKANSFLTMVGELEAEKNCLANLRKLRKKSS
jgi:hypothetical protein